MDNLVSMIKSTTDVHDREGSTVPFSNQVSSMKQIAQLLVSNTRYTSSVKHFLFVRNLYSCKFICEVRHM